MKTCPRCNASIEETCRFCPNCGASQIVIAVGAPEAEAPATSPLEPAPPPVPSAAEASAGEPVPPPIAPPPALIAPALLRPALVSGLLMGGLSALPFVNLCCCLWMIGGGMLASYLYMKQVAVAPSVFGMTSTEGAKVGLAAGFFGFITGVVIFGLLQLVMGVGRGAFWRGFREGMQEAMARQGEVPPQTRQFFDWLSTPAGAAFTVVLTITMFFVAFIVLGALGGMLGASLFRKNPRPAAS